MPFIAKDLITEEIEFGNYKTLVLNSEKMMSMTKELSIDEELQQGGLSYKSILELRNIYGNFSLFSDFFKKNNKVEKVILFKSIENVEEFYNILWERTIIEIMFISQYYFALISNLETFDQIVKVGSSFGAWFKDIVEYNMIEKVKRFYLTLARVYANKLSFNIYESDIEIKLKDLVNEIKGAHLLQVKELLESAWNESMSKYDEWEKVQQAKRKTIIFD